MNIDRYRCVVATLAGRNIDGHLYVFLEVYMSRVQLALNVRDLDESIAFYSALFNTEPAKIRPGYANFAVAEPPLKLVLIENAEPGGDLNHLGIEVADTDAVESAHARLRDAGLASTEERDGTCCYAKQHKFWVQHAPNDERWEIYTVLADSPTSNGEAAGGLETCCHAEPADSTEPGATAFACC
jgi:catechol 2,3-dioxygenase-like lactoylglutathione lyase family enzyme